ncbi:hypothetical protein RF11_00344 [Thelohanellus kitauei]|uniref:Uncharacterized protein n=1 Tax=Thelohanellus kitauei TaxID=669202 RepID=A0A0C2NB44_THEKT|nr:hypothetical protein RF11_00344 [Thelohanellus kitauei]
MDVAFSYGDLMITANQLSFRENIHPIQLVKKNTVVSTWTKITELFVTMWNGEVHWLFERLTMSRLSMFLHSSFLATSLYGENERLVIIQCYSPCLYSYKETFTIVMLSNSLKTSEYFASDTIQRRHPETLSGEIQQKIDEEVRTSTEYLPFKSTIMSKDKKPLKHLAKCNFYSAFYLTINMVSVSLRYRLMLIWMQAVIRRRWNHTDLGASMYQYFPVRCLKSIYGGILRKSLPNVVRVFSENIQISEIGKAQKHLFEEHARCIPASKEPHFSHEIKMSFDPKHCVRSSYLASL